MSPDFAVGCESAGLAAKKLEDVEIAGPAVTSR
jgi:hypothetical protein